jgi:4-hydroxyacetophenone monooxygenase
MWPKGGPHLYRRHSSGLSELIAHLILSGQCSVDVTEDAYWRHNDGLDHRDAMKIYRDPCANNYYRNGYGGSAVNCPFPATDMWRFLRTPNFDELVID